MDRHPIELLHLIYVHISDYDLCSLASVCRFLHTTALNELFARKGVLIPTPTSVPPPSATRQPGQHFVDSYPSSGVCINLDGPDNLASLLALQLALPYIFHDRPITALNYSFYYIGAPRQLENETRSLGRFLMESASAVTIEAIVLNLGRGQLTAFERPPGILDVLHSFTPGLRRLPKCISLTITSGNSWLRESGGFVQNPSWLRSGHFGSNLIQTYSVLALERLNHLASSRSRTTKTQSMAPGILILNIDSPMILHPSLTKWVLTWFSRHLRSLQTLCIYQQDPRWRALIPQMNLPNLEELYLDTHKLSVSWLENFLVRHRKIKVLDLGTSLTWVDRPWSPPPHFLPNLATLVIGGRSLSYIFDNWSNLEPLPNLKSIIITIPIDFYSDTGEVLYRLRAWHIVVNRYTVMRLQRMTLGLRIYVKVYGTHWFTAESLPGAFPEQVKVCNHVRLLQVHLVQPHYFLESDDVRGHFPKWLQLFPVLESVEIWCCRPMNARNSLGRRELARSCKLSNSNLQEFAVNGVNLLNAI